MRFNLPELSRPKRPLDDVLAAHGLVSRQSGHGPRLGEVAFSRVMAFLGRKADLDEVYRSDLLKEHEQAFSDAGRHKAWADYVANYTGWTTRAGVVEVNGVKVVWEVLYYNKRHQMYLSLLCEYPRAEEVAR